MDIKRPAIVLFLYVLYSIILAYLQCPILIYILGLVLSCLVLFKLFPNNSLRVIFIVCIIFGLITFVHTNYKLNYNSELNQFAEKNITFTAKIVKAPVYKEDKTPLYVKDINIFYEGKTVHIKDKVLINVYYDYHTYNVGDYYKFTGKVKTPKAFDDFDYNLYLKTIGVYNYINVNTNKVEFNKSGHLIFYLDKIFELRDSFKLNLLKNIDDEENVNLIMGIMFSDKSLSEETTEDFNAVGLSHVLAVSGLHVGLIYGVILFIISMFNINKKYRVFIVAPILFMYVMLAGMSVSALRAMFLCILNELLSLKHEKDNDAFNNIFVIAIILLMINPLNLFNVSFLLSFSAVIGIILLAPVIQFKILEMFYEESRFKKNIVGLFSVSISAYLFTIPIILNSFGTVSIISIIGNLLIVPLMAPIMIIGIVGGLFGNFLFGMFLLHFLNIILSIIRYIISILASFPFATVSIENMSVVFIILYYFVLLLLSGYIKIPIKHKAG